MIRDIPDRLKKDAFRFVLLKQNEKLPFEKDWQNTANYQYSDLKLKSHLSRGGNVGVIGGFGRLRFLDCDKKDFAEKMIKLFPRTLTVQTGSGGYHFYFISDYSTNHVLTEERGEIRSKSYQVVCPPSIHPNGTEYRVVVNTEIVELSEDELLNIIKPYLRSNDATLKENIEMPKDFSRSAHEYRQVIRFIKEGKTKEEIFKIMDMFSKWKDAHPDYRELTYRKAYDFVKKKGLFKNMLSDLASINDKLVLIENFWKEHPFFYDRKQIFWFWNESEFRYVMLDDVDLLNMIDEALNNRNTISPKQKAEFVECLKRIGRKHIPKDCPNTWIQCKGTLINVETEEVFEPTHEYFLTNPLPFDLGTTTDTPVIDKLFIEWVGEKYAPTLYEIMAFCMIPDYFIHRIFVFVGGGMNGKSTFFELLTRFIGFRNCMSTELELLVKNRFEVAKLYKKLICFMGETNFNQLNDTSLIKRLTGGDMIGFEFKNKTPFDDFNYAKIIIATNTLPMTSDKTFGFYRRWEIIDFPRQFTEKKDVLKDVTDKELENLTKKCVGILFKLYKDRCFTNEGTVEERMQRFEEKSNPLGKFIKENTVFDSDGKIFKFEFEERFVSWLKSNRYRAWGKHEISNTLKNEHGWEDGKRDYGESRYWAWLGVSWVTSTESKASIGCNSFPYVVKEQVTPIGLSGQNGRNDNKNHIDILLSILENGELMEIDQLIKQGYNEFIIQLGQKRGLWYEPKPGFIQKL